MKKYLVAFKGYKKYQIESQDDATAAKWAELQLKVWKKDFKATVTQIVEEKPIAPRPAEEPVIIMAKKLKEKKDGNS